MSRPGSHPGRGPRGRLRLVAPAGAPVPLRTVLPSLAGGRTARPGLVDGLRERLGVADVFVASSGRAALTILLRALHQQSGRREVVIPAYTCFSVASAVARAGLTIRLCDVDPKTLDLDLNALARLDLGRALCIVPSSLYGIPGDLSGLEASARESGTFLIDDAAQCLGATVSGRSCGTFGDAGFYSLGRGKGITAMGGGIIVTHRDDLAARLGAAVDMLRRPRVHEVCAVIAGSLVYSGMLRPSRYWLVDRIPGLDLGASRFEPGFPLARLSSYQERLAGRLVPLLDAYNHVRRANAERLRAGIEDVEGIEIPRAHPGANPVFLRFPILTRDRVHRSDVLGRLRAVGVGASTSYPTPIGDIPGISAYLADGQGSCPGASVVASRILTLPTHPWVASRDLGRMIDVIRASRR